MSRPGRGVSSAPRVGMARNGPIRVAAVATAGAALYLLLLLVRLGFDASRLVRAGPPLTDPRQTLPSLTTVPGDYTFDGQFFYRLSVAPFSGDPRVAGVLFDVPALRGARWGLGALGYASSGGNPDLVPWVLPGLAVLFAGALAGVAAVLAQRSGRRPEWGLTLAVWPGFAYTLALDTAELMAAAALLAGILAIHLGRTALAALLFGVALVTRESTLAAVGGMWAGAVLGLLLARRRSRPTAEPVGWLVATSSAGFAFAANQAYGLWRFGAIPLVSSGEGNLGVPFGGLVAAVRTAVPPHSGSQLLDLLGVLVVAAWLAVGVGLLRRSRAALSVQAAWVLTALTIVCLDGPWVSAASSLRAGTELGVLTAVLFFATDVDAWRGRRYQRWGGLAAVAATGCVAALTVAVLLARVPPAA